MTHAERIRQRDEDDMRTLLKEPWGRRIVWRWLGKCRVNNISFVQGEPESTAFNEGMRNVGNTLLAEVMRIDPESYLKMVKSARKDDELMAKETEDERRNDD